MSVHKSLVIGASLSRSRNVFTRVERLEKLEKEGKWKEGASVFALPKVKTRLKTRKIKKEKKVEGAEGAEGGAAPAPAAAAAPAKDAAKDKKKK